MLIHLLQMHLDSATVISAVRKFIKILSVDLLKDASEGYSGKLFRIAVTPYNNHVYDLILESLKKEGLTIVNNKCSKKEDSVYILKITIVVSWRKENQRVEYADSAFYNINLKES